MIATMPKPRRSVGRPKAVEPSETVSTRVEESVKDVLQALADENYRSISAEVYIAIEERLKKLNRWPKTAKADKKAQDTSSN